MYIYNCMHLQQVQGSLVELTDFVVDSVSTTLESPHDVVWVSIHHFLREEEWEGMLVQRGVYRGEGGGREC